MRKRLEASEPFTALDAADQEVLLASASAAEPAISAAEQPWQPLSVTVVTDSTATTIVALPDNSVRFEGSAADKDTYVLVARTPLESVAAVRVEVLADDALPQRGPGRNPQNGNLHLSEIRIIAAPLATPEKAAPIKVRTALADFSQAGWEVTKAIDGRPETAWGVHPLEGASHQAVFIFDKPIAHQGGVLLTIRLEQLHGEKHLIGRLRLSAASQAPGPTAVVSPDVLALINIPAAQRTAADRPRIAAALARQVIEQKLASPVPAQGLCRRQRSAQAAQLWTAQGAASDPHLATG